MAKKNPLISLYVRKFGRITTNGSWYMIQILQSYTEQSIPLDADGIKHLILAVSKEKGLKPSSIRSAIKRYLDNGWNRNPIVWKRYTAWKYRFPPDVNTAIRLLCASYVDFEKSFEDEHQRTRETINQPFPKMQEDRANFPSVSDHRSSKKKIICSFIGHKDVYDADIQFRIQSTVDGLVAEYEAVEFYVYPDGDFSYICLLVALKARTYNPQKVTIALISDHSSTEEMLNSERAFFCMSDKLITPVIQESKKDDITLKQTRMMQWIVQNSTHVISYFYDTLYDPHYQPIKFQRALKYDLTTPETEAAILNAVSFLTEKEQLIFQKMNEGCTLKDAGKVISVGSERARQILQHGCRTIRLELEKRYHSKLTAEQKSKKTTCGLFALGEGTFESLTRFKRITDFLFSIYDVRDIYVDSSYSLSSFLFALVYATASRIALRETKITALMCADTFSADDDDQNDIRKSLCPPCHSVTYVSRVGTGDDNSDFDVISDMIERADFCICDLSSAQYSEKIREFAAQTRGSILLDIGIPNDANYMRCW